MAVANAISDWKNKAIELVIGQDEIMELLDMDEAEADDPMYTRIFPYNHIPQTIEETKVYITFTVNVPKITFNKIWAYPRLTVRIIAHQDRMKLNNISRITDVTSRLSQPTLSQAIKKTITTIQTNKHEWKKIKFSIDCLWEGIFLESRNSFITSRQRRLLSV